MCHVLCGWGGDGNEWICSMKGVDVGGAGTGKGKRRRRVATAFVSPCVGGGCRRGGGTGVRGWWDLRAEGCVRVEALADRIAPPPIVGRRDIAPFPWAATHQGFSRPRTGKTPPQPRQCVNEDVTYWCACFEGCGMWVGGAKDRGGEGLVMEKFGPVRRRAL